MQITSEAEAFEVLIDAQVPEGFVATIPASAETIATDLGLAFFNVNGYLAPSPRTVRL